MQAVLGRLGQGPLQLFHFILLRWWRSKSFPLSEERNFAKQVRRAAPGA